MDDPLFRGLQDGQNDSPSEAPTDVPASAPLAPAAATDDNNGATALSFLIFLVVFALAICMTMRLVRSWRRRRNEDMMQARSEAADTVLGDMQMVPNEDLDHELI
jgi:flagellar biosynthesis/type III secretory pathway M-ring protein FliF/YscJ